MQFYLVYVNHKIDNRGIERNKIWCLCEYDLVIRSLVQAFIGRYSESIRNSDEISLLSQY